MILSASTPAVVMSLAVGPSPEVELMGLPDLRLLASQTVSHVWFVLRDVLPSLMH